jgi:uncharacterized protein (TIGR02266 family)
MDENQVPVSGKERRKFPRVDAVIKVRFKNKNEYITSYSQNISRGGIFLRVNQLPDPNAQVELEFTLPGENDVIKVLGRIVRLMSNTNPEKQNELVHEVGIAFLNLNEDAKKQFKRFYQKYA